MLSIQGYKSKNRYFRGPAPQSVAILARNPSKQPVDKIIQDSRLAQEKLTENVSNVKFQEMCDLRADWERSTDKRMQITATKQKLRSHQRLMEINLDERRDKLRALLEAEQAYYVQTMDDSQETTLERQAKMREKARQLKEQKEMERQKLAAEKYDQLFRSQCEELRSTLSKRAQDEIAAERLEQIKLKKVLDEEKKEEDAFFAQLWQDEIRKKAEREERDTQAQMQRNREQIQVLEQQKAAVAAQREDQLRLKEEEAQLLKEMAELRRIEDARALEEKRRQQAETRQLYDTNVKLKLKRKAREVQEELAFDMKILEQLLEQSRNEAIEDMRRKRELREEDRRYREYLQQAKAAEIARERELERLLDAEIEKQWKKRLEQWENEKKARNALLQQVIADRKQQIQERVLENERRQQEAAAERKVIAEQIEKNRLLDIQERDALQAKNDNYQRDLLGQIAFNQHLRDLDKEEEHRQWLKMSEAEKVYQQRLKEALENEWIDPKMHPMRRRHMMMQSASQQQ